MTKDNPYQIGTPNDKPANTEKSTFFKNKPINKDSNRKPFNNNKERKPFDKKSPRPFNNNNRKPFERTDRKPFDRNNRKSFDKNDKRPFSRNQRKPFQKNDGKPFDRNQRKPFGRNDRKPFDRNDKKPFNKDGRKPLNRGDKKPYKSGKFANRKFDDQKQNRNLKHEQKEFKENNQQNEENQINSKENKVEEKGQKGKVEKIKHNRIIIRNLVFDINVNHLKKLLSPFGEILDVHIPQHPDGKGSRGFAFIEFKNRNNALKAIKQLNGTTFKGRPIVLDESVSKQKYLQNKINDDEKANEDNKIEEQVKEKVKLEENKKQKLEMESEEEVDEEENNQEEKEDNQEEEEIKEDKEQKVKKEGSKRQKTESQILEDISSEIFIRNLPITVNQQSLHSFFRKYGKLKFAKIVMNKQTGLSKGTAFLKFEDPVKAKELIQYSRSYEMNLLGKNPNFKVNAGINLQLQGTVLKLFPVESRQNITEKVKGREELDAKREEAKKQEEKKKKPIKKVKTLQKLVEYDPNDKRNLKLALLGINQVTEQMREKDQERFRNHEKEKLEKLKNPNNSVSDTRIVLKYLNKDITEQDIRNLCLEYLQDKSHKANDLTYCKLMLESLESKKSAGYAFVEFKNHQIALGFLEWIAEEPSKLMKEPFICEFAIQDSRKLQKLQNRSNSKPKTQNTKSASQSKGKSMSKSSGKSLNKNKGKKHNK